MSSLHCTLWSFKKFGLWSMIIVLQNTVREIVHRRHTKTTVGTTLKGHYWIVQYRLIQYIDGDYIHTTLTQWTEDRIETWRLPDLHLEEGAWRFMSARFLLKHSLVPRPPADGEKKEKCFKASLQIILHTAWVIIASYYMCDGNTGGLSTKLNLLHSRLCGSNNSSACFAKNKLLILLTAARQKCKHAGQHWL